LKTGNPSLRFLYSLQKSGIKAGLGNIRSLLCVLGHPERVFPSVHVAGTNGKGSTSAMIAAVLTAAGYRTGLYTSPHLVSFTERIRIDGRKIPTERVAGCTRRLAREIRRTGATFFDATTAIAFQYFADRHVDIAVIETGLGGRWDSTNVITPLVSVITSIGLEHTEYLGDTLRKIASEKAGIIKPGIPCVVGPVGGPGLEAISKRAARTGSRLVRIRRRSFTPVMSSSTGGQTVDFRFGKRTISGLLIGAMGNFQAGNAAIALKALELLGRAEKKFLIDEQAIRRGFSSLRTLAGFSGRFQFVGRDPAVIADVAHNPDGVRALVSALRTLHAGRFRIVFGAMRDKDYRTMIDLLGPIARMFYFVRPMTERAGNPRELTDYAHSNGLPGLIGGDVAAGIRMAKAENRYREPILITGSHFVVGEALQALNVRV